ncbi:MAG: hypothetical protein LBM93_02935 [Oscillospiraceae bacterium]|jgi:hypothetical protein|nr:hypothetical protein [Oscillospiraceae bacterium]
MFSATQINELLSFNSGEPIIVTPCGTEQNFNYDLVIFVKTLTNTQPTFVSSVSAVISLISQDGYYPFVKLKNTRIFHPNFTATGVWTGSNIMPSETVSDYLMRLVKVLQFKEIDVENIGNRNAMAWYNKNVSTGIFPTDPINYHTKSRISIIQVNQN